MLVIISYDVSTSSPEGAKRLRHIARVCENFGQRVQNSVFECNIDNAQFLLLKQRLLDEADLKSDSLRFYFLGDKGKGRYEHHGAKPSLDLEGLLLM